MSTKNESQKITLSAVRESMKHTDDTQATLVCERVAAMMDREEHGEQIAKETWSLAVEWAWAVTAQARAKVARAETREAVAAAEAVATAWVAASERAGAI